MVENRLKFDRDVLAHGSDDYEDYDDWDPWLDLDEEDHEVRRFDIYNGRSKFYFIRCYCGNCMHTWTVTSMVMSTSKNL